LLLKYPAKLIWKRVKDMPGVLADCLKISLFVMAPTKELIFALTFLPVKNLPPNTCASASILKTKVVFAMAPTKLFDRSVFN